MYVCRLGRLPQPRGSVPGTIVFLSPVREAFRPVQVFLPRPRDWPSSHPGNTPRSVSLSLPPRTGRFQGGIRPKGFAPLVPSIEGILFRDRQSTAPGNLPRSVFPGLLPPAGRLSGETRPACTRPLFATKDIPQQREPPAGPRPPICIVTAVDSWVSIPRFRGKVPGAARGTFPGLFSLGLGERFQGRTSPNRGNLPPDHVPHMYSYCSRLVGIHSSV